MKKLLLVLFILSIGLFIKGQNLNDKLTFSGPANKFLMLNSKYLIGAKESPSPFLQAKSSKNNLEPKNVSYGNLHSYYVQSSVNLYTLLNSTSTCLTANQALNTVMFTCRDDHFTDAKNILCNIISSFRVNPDTIWKHINITGAQTRGDRYPSGVIYNPTSNTLPSQAYSVITGPITGNNARWTGNYFGSARLDSTNINIENVSKDTYMQDFPSNGLTACDDGMLHVLAFDSLKYDTSKFVSAVMNNGSFDAAKNKFNWSQVKIRPSLYKGMLNLGNLSTAWSQDGSTGYVYFFGVDSINKPNTFYPIVYQSTDKGETWNQLDYFNFQSLKVITERIHPIHYKSNFALPLIMGLEGDAVVDSTGNLHIFTVIMGSYTDNIDTIGSYWVTIGIKDPYDANVEPLIDQKIFDLYTKDDGTWGAQYVDSLRSQSVTTGDALNSLRETGSIPIGWDHRMKASRTTTGGKIFLTWTDDDTASTHDVANLNPNLIIYGKDIHTGFRAKKNFTRYVPNFDSQMLFHCAGNITLNEGSQYKVPITYIKLNASKNPGDVTAHYFLDGVYFNETDFIDNLNVKDISNKSLISVSQNYPNPFSGSTSINIYLPESHTISLEVRNLLGQKVYEMGAKYVSAGNHTIVINNNNLIPGIYFYTFRADQFSVTKKMIVR